MTLVNALFQGFTLDNTSNETTSESVTGTGGIVDLLLGDFVNGVFRGLNAAGSRDSSHSGEGSLSNDHDTGPLGVLLLEGGELLGDFGDVSQTPAVALGVGESFGFVADEVVDVGDDAVELVFEELRDEGGGEGEDEGLYKHVTLAIIAVVYFTPELNIPYCSKQPLQQEPKQQAQRQSSGIHRQSRPEPSQQEPRHGAA